MSSDQVKLTAAEIKAYFEEATDRIESVRLCTYSTRCYGIVYLRETKNNTEYFQKNIRINDAVIEVVEQPTVHHIRLDTYEQSSSAPIMWLNDYCIQRVFSFLDVIDLINAAEVCHRFKENARSKFAVQHKKLPWFRTTSAITSKINLLHISRLLRNFGMCIDRLRIESPMKPNQLMQLIVRHCGPALRTLTMINVTMDDRALMQRLRSVLSHLQYLEMYECNELFIQMLPSCKALRRLTIMRIPFTLHSESDADSVYSSLNRCFPKLDWAYFVSMDFMTSTHFANFLKKNSHLKALGILPLTDALMLQAICQHVPLIEELYLECSGAMEWELARCLEQLTALKKIELTDFGVLPETYPLIMNALMSCESVIEHLGFRNCLLTDADIEDICNMVHVKSLRFENYTYAPIEFSHILTICKELNIEKLELIDSHVVTMDELLMLVDAAKKLSVLWIHDTDIDIDTFKCISDKVASREEQCSLEIRLFHYKRDLMLPKELLNAHAHVVNVKYRDHFEYYYS